MDDLLERPDRWSTVPSGGSGDGRPDRGTTVHLGTPERGNRRVADQLERTIVFIDVAGFTGLTELHGDKIAADIAEGPNAQAMAALGPTDDGPGLPEIGQSLFRRLAERGPVLWGADSRKIHPCSDARPCWLARPASAADAERAVPASWSSAAPPCLVSDRSCGPTVRWSTAGWPLLHRFRQRRRSA